MKNQNRIKQHQSYERLRKSHVNCGGGRPLRGGAAFQKKINRANPMLFGFKKAQVQMMETIAVLLIFFILIVLGIVFYGNVMKGNIQQEQEEALQLNAIKIAQRASFLPELQCSEDNIVSENCIDLIKLEVAADIMNRPENEIHYYDRLLFTKITVAEIYPAEREWTLYDRELDDFSNKIVTNVPISLFNPLTDEHAFGVMKVEFFTQ